MPTFDPNLIWVDFNYMGAVMGTELFPFNSLGPALFYVAAGGIVRMKGPATSAETLTINQDVRLEATGGAVTIGK